jgi:glycosyltransferase involved in cell wall biosynthesis
VVITNQNNSIAVAGKRHGISVIVPVYRSASTLESLHRRLVDTFEATDHVFEIIMVEDCGGDESWTVIEQLALADKRVRGIRLSRNYGQHNAILCGLRAAEFEISVTLDDDLQNPPEEIPKLLEKLMEGYDVVYGTPEREQHGFLRDFASRITKLVLQNAMGAETARKISAFRAFKTDLRAAFENYRGPFVSIDVLLTWGTTRFSTVTVSHQPRAMGESAYSVSKLITHAFNMVTGFSTLPLQLASLMGFAFAFFGLIVLGFVLVRYWLSGASVPGFPFLAAIIAIFSGAQLCALGIFGEYLARIHFRTMDRPSYAVRNLTDERKT